MIIFFNSSIGHRDQESEPDKIPLGGAGYFDKDLYGEGEDNTIGKKKIISTGYVQSIGTDDNSDEDIDEMGGKYIYLYLYYFIYIVIVILQH